MSLSICIKCGTAKRIALRRCSACGFDPSKDEDSQVRSVYLSTGRYEDPADQEYYALQLPQLAASIRSGQPVEFEAAELDRLRDQKRLVESVPLRAVWGAVFRLFLPGLLLIAGIWLLVLVLTLLKK
jgi:hypothetical protein